MFKIYGNRPELWQWDIGQKLIVEDERINEVHFCDGMNSQALVCEVYELEGQRVVDIPNVVLQDNCDMNIFTYCDMNVFAFVKDQDGSYTKHREIIKVKKRSKPTDYVYTETEVKRYETLEKRIDEIEKNGVSNETIAGAVEEYLNENPIEVPEVDLSGLATEEYVNRKVEEIEIPEGDFAKTSDIPTKVSQLANDSSYASESFVTNAITNAQLGGGDTQIDLSGYATKDDLINKVDKAAGKSLIADNEIERLKNVTNYDDTEIKNILNSKANTSSIPTKTSQLTNDSGFITGIPSEYVTENELNNKGYLTAIPSEYVTESEMNDAISNIGGGNVSSNTVNSIMVVDALPEIEVEGVLYLVKESEIEVPDEPSTTNLWEDATILSGYFFDTDFTKISFKENAKYKSAYIACEANTTYNIKRTMDGYRFRIANTATTPIDGVAYSNYMEADSSKDINYTTSSDAKYLVIYYVGSSETLDATQLFNDIVVTKAV